MKTFWVNKKQTDTGIWRKIEKTDRYLWCARLWAVLQAKGPWQWPMESRASSAPGLK